MKGLYISLLLICSLSCYAREGEPAFEKGTITATLAFGFPNENKVTAAYVSLGPYLASADYQVSNRFCVSLLYSYMYSASHLHTVIVNNGSPFEYEHKLAVSTIMATGAYCYRNRGRVWMSGGLGLGVAIPKNTLYFTDGQDHSHEPFITHTRFVYRLRLLDVKVKVTKDLSLYGGLGFGLDGILNAGINYRI